MKRILLTITLVAWAAAFAGCCSCHDTANDRQFPKTEINYSSGGGVTGMSSGYSILSDGAIVRWNGRAGQHEQSVGVGKIDPAKFHALLLEMYDMDPVSIHQQETGNMTTSLGIVSDDVVYTYTWPGVYGDDDAVPTIVRPLRDLVWKHIQDALAD